MAVQTKDACGMYRKMSQFSCFRPRLRASSSEKKAGSVSVLLGPLIACTGHVCTARIPSHRRLRAALTTAKRAEVSEAEIASLDLGDLAVLYVVDFH